MAVLKEILAQDVKLFFVFGPFKLKEGFENLFQMFSALYIRLDHFYPPGPLQAGQVP